MCSLLAGRLDFLCNRLKLLSGILRLPCNCPLRDLPLVAAKTIVGRSWRDGIIILVSSSFSVGSDKGVGRQ